MVALTRSEGLLNVAIIDADLIGKTRHRFPNLACMKLSAYWKARGANVELKQDYSFLSTYDRVFVCKVFTDTPVPDGLSASDRVQLGGTGFFFDKAEPLPSEVEHVMPDYHLYDEYIKNRGGGMAAFKGYRDYSIGFLTRGCFRRCAFCVNQKYRRVFVHSPLAEFYDPSRRKICLLDDNFLGFSGWRSLLEELQATERKFKFNQGLDERLLTDEICRVLFASNYDGDYTFAFDNVADYDLIRRKLELIKKYQDKGQSRFYVLCGFEGIGIDDIENAFKRIELLFRYECLPYVMRYAPPTGAAPWRMSEFRGMYVQLARWSNQPAFVKKMSFREFCEAPSNSKSARDTLHNFELQHPDIARKYFDLHFGG